VARFLLWLLIVAGAYGGLAGGYHAALLASPRKIAVAVDSSYEMQAARDLVAPELQEIAQTRYARFSLWTDKARVHGWDERLGDLGGQAYYGPRNLTLLVDPSRFPEARDADQIVVITNARSREALPRSRRIRIVTVGSP